MISYNVSSEVSCSFLIFFIPFASSKIIAGNVS